MPQYFDNDDSIKSERQLVYFKINDVPFALYSDRGVFSTSMLDFGSRTLIEESIKDGLSGKVLDLGCGWGPIGISIATLVNNLDVTMSDVNRRAVELSKLNATNSNLKNVKVLESDIFSNINDSFDVILLNPPIRAGKETIYKMFLESKEHLLDKGKLLIVIRKDQGEPSAKKKLLEIYNNCEIIKRNKGYYILKCIK